jgi:hypothetical protein
MSAEAKDDARIVELFRAWDAQREEQKTGCFCYTERDIRAAMSFALDRGAGLRPARGEREENA